MRLLKGAFLAGVVVSLTVNISRATDFYVSLTGGHVPPFTNWVDAATNIQDAIDAASAGDTVWVTNGVYNSGGKVMAGDLTNRVALDKALTVQSVNGPDWTVIQGAWDRESGDGPGAVRCSWLTNGAVLSGFTLQGGATLNSGDPATLRSGGGVWGVSALCVVTNCVVENNSANSTGGGAYQATLKNSVIRNNRSVTAGGAANCLLEGSLITKNLAASFAGGTWFCASRNCAIVGNVSYTMYGGDAFGTLTNCSITGNAVALTGSSGNGVGAYSSTLVNCIVYGNKSPWLSQSGSNYANCTFTYSCTAPLPPGQGNISTDPKLLGDGIHIAEESPCRGAGTNSVVGGRDIDGQLWSNAPAMGCDEWTPFPVVATLAQVEPARSAARVSIGTVARFGADPVSLWWLKDGVILEDSPHYGSIHDTNLTISNFGPADAGLYQVLASNSVGTTVATVARVTVHCVDASNSTPALPFFDWLTASTNIQDAIDAAVGGDIVLVTNGVYQSGGKAKYGDLTNRVVLDKPLLLLSVNGPGDTIIQGERDPETTNGPTAVRCAWVVDGASVSGFTLRNGATRVSGDPRLGAGGGVWFEQLGLLGVTPVFNCVVTNNAASRYGGGVYAGAKITTDSAVRNCQILNNSSDSNGGGTYGSYVFNSLLKRNFAVAGGGAAEGHLVNCTVVENHSLSAGGGTYFASAQNSIIYFNTSGSPIPNYFPSGGVSGIDYCCTTPPVVGRIGNISADPQLTDGVHLATTSPCRQAGTSVASGTDLDGETWMSPPSIGCDEVWETGITGALAVAISAPWPEVAAKGLMPLTGQVFGHASKVAWDYGDGSLLTNGSYATSHVWTNDGDYTVTFTAFNSDNTNGVATNLLVHVVPLEAPQITPGGLTNTSFSLSFPGQPGVTYTVEQATNLALPITWQTVSTISSTGQLMQVIDTKATNDMRFYRVKGP